MQRARADPLIRQAIGDRLRALWADPGYRLRVMAGRWRSLDARAWQRVQAGTPAAVAAYLAQRRRWRRTLDALRAAVG